MYFMSYLFIYLSRLWSLKRAILKKKNANFWFCIETCSKFINATILPHTWQKVCSYFLEVCNENTISQSVSNAFLSKGIVCSLYIFIMIHVFIFLTNWFASVFALQQICQSVLECRFIKAFYISNKNYKYVNF